MNEFLNEEFLSKEVTISRDEVAHIMADATRRALDVFSDKTELGAMIVLILAAYSADVLHGIFDADEDNSLEVE